MKSIIVEKLKPDFKVVVILTSNEKPENALSLIPGKYACIMPFFAQVAKNGKTAVFSRETYGCPGAKAGLGFGTAYNEALGGYETFGAFFSKGIQSAKDKENYQRICNNAPNNHVKEKLEKGERFHTSYEKAYKWVSEDLPLTDFKEKYVIMKPLEELKENEIPKSVIFTVNPLQLTALITLSGSITEGINEMITPQGAACQMIGNFVFEEDKKENPRAVLGLLDLAARYTVRGIISDNYLNFSTTWNMFLDLEKEAKDGIFESPLWTNFNI